MRIKYEVKSSIDNSVEFSKLKSGDIIQTWWNNEREYIIKIENEEIFIGGFRKINSNDKWQRYNNNNKINITIIKRVFENPFQQGNYAIYINTNRIVRIESKIVMTSTGLFRTRCSWYPNLNQYGYVVDLDKLMPIEWDFHLLKSGNIVKLKEDNNNYKIEVISFECGTIQLKQIGQNQCASMGANHLIAPMCQIEYVFEEIKFIAPIIKVDAKTKFLPSELKRFIMDNLEIGDVITREGNDQFKYRVVTIDPLRRSIGLDQAIRIKPVEVHDYKTPFHIYFENVIEIHKANPFFQQKLYFKMNETPVLAGPVRKEYRIDIGTLKSGEAIQFAKNAIESLLPMRTQVEIKYQRPDPKYVYQDIDNMKMYWPWEKIPMKPATTLLEQKYLEKLEDYLKDWPIKGKSPLDLIIIDYCNMIQTSKVNSFWDEKHNFNLEDTFKKIFSMTEEQQKQHLENARMNYLKRIQKDLEKQLGELTDMKDFDKKNMQAGKEAALAERKRFEEIESQKRYSILLKQLDSINEQIEMLQKQKEAVEKEMAKFD